MSVREPKDKTNKRPRKGNIATPLIDINQQLPGDPFGNDYFKILNDINELDADDNISEEGYKRKDKLMLRYRQDSETSQRVGQKDPNKRTSRQGSITRNISQTDYDTGSGRNETVILEPGINNALERLRNNDPSAFNTDIIENIYTEMAKVSKIQEMDPVMKENRKRLHVANRFGITALTTELMGQILQTQQQILIELREDRRIRTQEEKIDGKNVVAEFTLPASTGVIRFDFSELESFIGPTSIKNKLQNFSSKKIFAIQVIINSGGPLYIATNEDDLQRTYTPVTSTYEMTCDKGTVKWINMRAVVDATVTLIGTY